MKHSDVLIIGAGPTGLVLALWLTRLGVGVRIVDRLAEAGTTSRAVAVAAHTLELYAQLDLADALVARAHEVPAANLWVRGRVQARVPFAEIGKGLSPLAFLHIFPQDEHERLLIARLEAAGVTVERRTELIGFTQEADRVVARLRHADGEEEACTCAYLAGCDGARSATRHVVGADFAGGTYDDLFYVADIAASGEAMNGELHIDLDEADFLAIFPMAARGRARLIGTVRDERAAMAETLTFEDVGDRAIANMRLRVEQVNWFSTYRVHHRVADRFRRDRAFLLGDAAHIHSPVGGQGMNTGIGDAINLAWKLAAVLAGRAPDALLDSYEAERRAFARRLVATTDRAFTFVTADGRLADLARTRLAPLVLPRLLSLDRVRDFMFRTVSQIGLNYRESALSAGHAGEVHGGDRMPWAPAPNRDNFAPLADPVWQVHVYGAADEGVRAWCERQGVPLHVFAWDEAHAAAGLQRDAVYLIRPDTYVAVASPDGSAEALDRYVAAQGLRLGTT